MAQPNSEFFPAIGQIADKTDLLPDRQYQLPSQDDQNEDQPVEEIESLCMNCHEQGTTRMLLTSIPYFKEVIIMSFRCEFCGNSNNEIQSAGSIRPEGTVYTTKILNREDLNRQLVKSATCTVMIPQFELTIPPSRGQLTTVEGLMRDIIADLGTDQPLRKYQNEAAYTKIQGILDAFKKILGDKEDGTEGSKVPDIQEELFSPFTISLDDPAGNSFIEFIGSMSDPKWNLRTYHRTRQQNVELGLIAAEDDAAAEDPDAIQKMKQSVDNALAQAENASGDVPDEEILVFPGTCSSCGRPLDTLMKKVIIPYFKDIFIMSTNCDACGYRDNEVKSGSAISKQGKKITLKVEDSEDLSRDILKSETCGLEIPEIDLVLQAGTLGGRFTTLEGILDQVYEELSDKVFAGDSSNDVEGKSTFVTFLTKLKEVKLAEHPFTLILDDPLANSYLQNIYAPDPDPNMTIEVYDRSYQQNEELGLNDMKLEGYEEDEIIKDKALDVITEETS